MLCLLVNLNTLISQVFLEAEFLRQLISDILGMDKQHVTLFVDDQGAIELAKNSVYHQRLKHIDIRYHFIRSEVQSETVILNYILTGDKISDIFTKPLTKAKLNKFKYIRGELTE